MSRSILTSFLVVAGLLAAAPTVHAEESRIHWYAMAGYSDTLGSTSNYLQGGYILGAGIGAYYTRIELDQTLPFYDGYGYRVWLWLPFSLTASGVLKRSQEPRRSMERHRLRQRSARIRRASYRSLVITLRKVAPNLHQVPMRVHCDHAPRLLYLASQTRGVRCQTWTSTILPVMPSCLA